ncbi:MAG: hypothetical protein R2789_14990 [Microthrixaceae bacterium]
MPSTWLQTLAWISLITAVLCAAAIVADIRIRGYRQPMGVMEAGLAHPLYLGPFGLAFYWMAGRTSARNGSRRTVSATCPHWVRVGVSSTHCGGGCTSVTSSPRR